MSCICGTKAFPRFDPGCALHGLLAMEQHASPQGDGDPGHDAGKYPYWHLDGPIGRMTFAEPTQQQVWLLWRNEVVIGVFGTETACWRELMEMQAVIGSLWVRVDDYARVWCNHSDGVTLRMEPREVHW